MFPKRPRFVAPPPFTKEMLDAEWRQRAMSLAVQSYRGNDADELVAMAESIRRYLRAPPPSQGEEKP